MFETPVHKHTPLWEDKLPCFTEAGATKKSLFTRCNLFFSIRINFNLTKQISSLRFYFVVQKMGFYSVLKWVEILLFNKLIILRKIVFVPNSQ